jgi:hypothetical protein
MSKTIRLTGDGTVGGTKVYVVEGDTEVDITNQVTSMAIAHKAGDLPRVTLTLTGFTSDASLGFDVRGVYTPKVDQEVDAWPPADPRVGQVQKW